MIMMCFVKKISLNASFSCALQRAASFKAYSGLTFILRGDFVNLIDGFLADVQSLPCPRLNISETHKENRYCPELSREGVVGVQDKSMNRRLVNVSKIREKRRRKQITKVKITPLILPYRQGHKH